MSERRLVSIRRLVPLERLSDYDALWGELHAGATARGAHAWRFVAAAGEEVYIEFLEFRAGDDPRDDPGAATALQQLQAAFAEPPPPAEGMEEWREVRRE